MIFNNNHVVSALDLSRVNKGYNDIHLYGELDDIVHLGREIDFLETIRRQDNPEKDVFTFPKDELIYYGAPVGLTPIVLNRISLKNFEDYGLITVDEDSIEVNFQDWRKILSYGKSQINELNSRSQELLNLLSEGMVKPLQEEFFQTSISEFPTRIHSRLEDYLDKTKLLCPIQANETVYYSSPKIYKHQDRFRQLLEESEGSAISNALEFLTENPGIPMDSINPRNLSHGLLQGLTLSGSLDSITLDVGGTSRDYLIPSNLNNDRLDRDYLDQVKKTLANFRYGERYAFVKLESPKMFLESLLENGYAGNASPIGTDYRYLEAAGIVRVEKTRGSFYRLWMLKKDVIEDTIKVLNGAVPVISENPNINLNEMNDSDLSRMILEQTKGPEIREITDAVRQIEGALF